MPIKTISVTNLEITFTIQIRPKKIRHLITIKLIRQVQDHYLRIEIKERDRHRLQFKTSPTSKMKMCVHQIISSSIFEMLGD